MFPWADEAGIHVGDYSHIGYIQFPLIFPQRYGGRSRKYEHNTVLYFYIIPTDCKKIA